MTTAGSLGSTGVTPLPRYYAPHRLPTYRLTRLLIPTLPQGYEPRYAGSLRFLDQSFAARCPLPPRQVDPVHTLVASRIVLASTFPAVWPLATCVSRPIFGSTCDGLRLAALLSAACATSPGVHLRTGLAPRVSLPPRDRPQLHVQPTIYMATSFQIARLARLNLTHQRAQRKTGTAKQFSWRSLRLCERKYGHESASI